LFIFVLLFSFSCNELVTGDKKKKQRHKKEV
jgi:hypothetical protein